MNEFAKHNVNNQVKVKLTKKGQEILDARYSKWDLINQITADDKGYTSFQMHDLMATFGEYMILGYEVPFDAQILIEVSESGDSNDN